MSVLSTIISVHSQLWREMRRHSCRKYKSVWSILGARCRTGVGPGFCMPAFEQRQQDTTRTGDNVGLKNRKNSGIRLPTLLQSDHQICSHWCNA